MGTGTIVGLAIIGGSLALVAAMKAYRRHLAGKAAGRGRGEEEPPPTDEFLVEPLGTEVVLWGCGHEAPARYRHNFYGTRLEPKDEVFEKRERCGDCAHGWFGTCVIRCVLCGHAIFPGEPVAVYRDMRRFRKAWKTYADREKTAVIGCMRGNCCPSGGFFCGHWTGEGIDSPFRTGSAVGDALANPGKMIVTNIGPDGTTVDTVDLDPGGGPDEAA